MTARTLVPLCTATLTLFLGLHAYGQSCGGSVTHQGETYATVQIGNQCWLAENIRSTVAKVWIEDGTMDLFRYSFFNTLGFSVRCVQNSNTP